MYRPLTRTSIAAVVAVAALALTSCAPTGATTSPTKRATAEPIAVDAALAATVPDDIRESGKVRLAMNPSYPPFETTKPDGTVVGFDPELAGAIGDILDLEIEIVPMSFDGIIPALQADKVDVAMSSIGDNLKREEVVDFATYYWNGTLVLVKDGNPLKVTPEMACGARIGVVRGTLQQNTFLPSHTPRCEEAGEEPPIPTAYNDVAQAILALQSDRIDGVLADASPVKDAEAKNDLFESAGPLLRNPNPGGAAFPKGSELVAPWNEAINMLIEDGTYGELLKKWDLDYIAVEKSEVNGAVE